MSRAPTMDETDILESVRGERSESASAVEPRPRGGVLRLRCTPLSTNGLGSPFLCSGGGRSHRSRRTESTDATGEEALKPFCVYILRCGDASYYVGHTDDLERRIAQHHAGTASAYTTRRLPVELVFSCEFASRVEALARERQVKGWSRAKKEALIAGEFERLRALARARRP
jgi:putative endonuclease